MNIDELEKISKDVRKDILNMSFRSKTPHIGPSFSCVDILVALFFDIMKKDDGFILSKGHAGMTYYSVLKRMGFLTEEQLLNYCKNGTKLSEHPTISVNGVEFGTGSLGHGLSVSCGRSLSKKIKQQKGNQYVVLGDGECDEGSVWEAAMFASKNNLNNLMAIIDKNGFQAIDRCLNSGDGELFESKWKSFGWDVYRCNGNLISEILFTFNKKEMAKSQKPTIIIADTIKGKGVSFMENCLEWHYKVPDKNELENALQELNK